MKKDPNAIKEPKFDIKEVEDEQMLTDIAGGWGSCSGGPPTDGTGG